MHFASLTNQCVNIASANTRLIIFFLITACVQLVYSCGGIPAQLLVSLSKEKENGEDKYVVRRKQLKHCLSYCNF